MCHKGADAIAIVIDLGNSAATKIRFVRSPMAELVASLHVITNPAHHGMQLRWALRWRRRMSPDLWREIRTLHFAYQSWILGLFSPDPAVPAPLFASEIDRLVTLPLPLFRTEVARAFLSWTDEDYTDGQLSESTVQAELMARAKVMDADYLEPLQQLFTDPEGLRQRTVSLLRWYWEEVFASAWRRVEPHIARDLAHKAELLSQHGLWALLKVIAPNSLLQPEQNRVIWNPQAKGVSLAISLDEVSHFPVIGSYFVSPHVRLECDAPWPYGIQYAIDRARRWQRAQVPEAWLVNSLGALADPNRLQILFRLMVEPLSTQQLAQMLHLSEAGVSRHISRLAAAGLVTRRRVSHYLFYRLSAAGMERVIVALQGLVPSKE